ncbi:hypothetical protein CSB20_00300, partial [bacterium DOLZORAL124_64_63]
MIRIPAKQGLSALALLGAALLWATPGAAGNLEQVLTAEADRLQLAQASQERIDQVVDETNDLATEYKQLLKQIDGLDVYNDYLERQIAGQEQELQTLDNSLNQVGVIERQIMPLMIHMLDGLEQFIQLDTPFLMAERMDRVSRLRGIMERADVTLAEKFRRLTEAFQIENDFGRTIEVYKDALQIDGATLEVNVLRLGRVGLYYQTNDASATGRWDADSKQWVKLSDGNARNQVRQGIRIA